MPKIQVTAADIRKALLRSRDAHKAMIHDEYDLGFNRGIEHCIYLIDQLLTEAWNKTLKQNAEKRYDFRFIERRKRK